MVESNEIQQNDQDMLKRVLDAIVADGRIVATTGGTFRNAE